MQRLAFALFAFAFIALGGCAANVKRDAAGAPVRVAPEASKSIALAIDGSTTATSAKDWEAFKGEWRSAMQTAASAAHVAYETRAPNGGQSGTLVSIYVDDYRYLSPGARYGLGIMTGNAFVDAKASFADLQSGASFGERSYNTSSSAWQGVFAAMTAKQIEAICKDIVAEVAGANPAQRAR